MANSISETAYTLQTAYTLKSPTLRADSHRRVGTFLLSDDTIVEVSHSPLFTDYEEVKAGDIVELELIADDEGENWKFVKITSKKLDRRMRYYVEVLLNSIKAEIGFSDRPPLSDEDLVKICISAFIQINKK
jgi:hypothetical protein